MKIKYIGNFKDGTGWAKASTYGALSLDAAGYDVYCEAVTYNNQNITIESKIDELLNKKSEDFDVIINHILPNNYRYIGGVSNIGFIELESYTISDVIWLKNIQMMDLIFVPNQASKECLIRSGIDENKIKIFHHSFNYDRVISNQSNASVKELDGKFNFVFVGEFSKRKNLEALIRAFHNEFDISEPVNLYIKTDKDIDTINGFCDSVKSRMKKSKLYKKEIIITDRLEEEHLLSTMSQCHAFVIPSYGEAWCYPAMEAMAMGIPPVYTKGIGVEEYSIKDFEVNSYITYCYGSLDNLDTLYTSEDKWLEIDIVDLQIKMREIYRLYFEDNHEYNKISQKCIESVSKFNFTNNELVRGIV